jgi:hypothetical protein
VKCFFFFSVDKDKAEILGKAPQNMLKTEIDEKFPILVSEMPKKRKKLKVDDKIA